MAPHGDDHDLRADLESILFDETTIHRRLDVLSGQITTDYRGRSLTVLALLQGSIIFMADLLRRIPLPLHVETLQVSSYHGGTQSSGTVTFTEAALPNLDGRHLLVLDDILDSGRTLDAVLRYVRHRTSPLSIRTAVLLQKRRPRALTPQADYVAFEIDDVFVVGYGLDYQGHYRNLPDIGILKPPPSSPAAPSPLP